ncbi:putative nucleic acid-binding Zn ribbon protein [Sphingobium wenxiniae]|uniref:Uncharacterized protein n=1 Tax=Sphingobium wenxiniae (strain DSM 21828 / CGMCC 1.7748 / JZ-1) TaxID=595605 RepID=A0A562KKS6_SPHWJ|nr:zinc ribbon domain-containing protein [Sphingobium wenxiniae]MBB6191172.1 putative nucleic acid-binding Zn ribbon protein [Sphingobium wenxiniae]TWH96028.1 hypothetical protein IQ35_01117 [Sphingobium wenxiniae]
MANCTGCGAETRPGDRFCGSCGWNLEKGEGAKPKGNRLRWIIGGILALIVVAALVDRPDTSSPSPSVSLASLDESAALPEKVPGWSYSSGTDEMSGKAWNVASVTSDNVVQLAPPYSGGSDVRMSVRRHPRHGTDVYFVLSSGQLLCRSYDGCSAMVRFDDAAPRKIRMNGASDHSSDTVFVASPAEFITRLKNAKKVVVSLEIYQGGEPNFTFQTEGLKWPPE